MSRSRASEIEAMAKRIYFADDYAEIEQMLRAFMAEWEPAQRLSEIIVKVTEAHANQRTTFGSILNDALDVDGHADVRVKRKHVGMVLRVSLDYAGSVSAQDRARLYNADMMKVREQRDELRAELEAKYSPPDEPARDGVAKAEWTKRPLSMTGEALLQIGDPMSRSHVRSIQLPEWVVDEILAGRAALAAEREGGAE